MLEVSITSKGQEEAEIEKQKAEEETEQGWRTVKEKKIKTNKHGIYRKVIQPSVLYDSKCWIINE